MEVTTNSTRLDALRAELRAWLAEHLTPAVIAAGSRPLDGRGIDALRAWNRVLADAGWAAPAWPSTHGGRDFDVDEQVVYLEEMSRARAPGPVNVIGVSNIAPAIMQYGTEAQQQRHLRAMLRGDEIWSQGMSEPDAGSDLASLRTSAVPDGDAYVINGQKTWNSLGHYADWCQLYVRTDPDAPKHRGITCFLVDLHSPGVEVRPITTISGEQAFAEVFLHDVRVPKSAMLGNLDEGWTVAMTTLSYERAGVARLHLGLANTIADILADPRARKALRDPRARDRFVRCYSEVRCMALVTSRSLATPHAHGGAGGSIAKLLWAECSQELAAIAVDLLGLDGLSGVWAEQLASTRQASIAGGTSEINRNIIGEHVLGLPR